MPKPGSGNGVGVDVPKPFSFSSAGHGRHMIVLFLRRVIFLAMLFAAVRLAIVATSTEIGWEFIATQFQELTLGPFSLGHTPIGKRPPSEQAEYWLRHVPTRLDKNPSSASIHMGAAWVLDSPDIGFLTNHLTQTEFANGFSSMSLDFDEGMIGSEKATFRERCLKQCLWLAKRATQLEPADVRWWRMRAALQFEADLILSGQDFQPRSTDWLEVLEAGEKHDPDNALYDYLAAIQLWNTSATYDWPDEPAPTNDEGEDSADQPGDVDHPQNDSDNDFDLWLLTVQDPKGFALANKHFLKAQKKPFLAIGEEGYPSIAEFLATSPLRKADQSEVAVSRLVTFRHGWLISRLWRWQSVLADTARLANDHEQELAILKQNLKLFEQAILPEETSALTILMKFGFFRQYSYEAIEKLNTIDPKLVEPVEWDKIRQREETLRIETATLRSSVKRLHDEVYPKKSTFSPVAVFSVATGFCAAALFAVSAISLLVAKMLSKHFNAGSQFGLRRHAVAWIIGCGVTFVVLGMAPAEMVSHEVQQLALGIGAWVMAICMTALAVWFVIRLLRLGKVRFQLATLFAVVTGVAVFTKLWLLLDFSFDGVVSSPAEPWIHAKGWNGVNAEFIRTAMQMKSGTWNWAWYQWFAHGGTYWGIVASMFLAIVWYMWRCAIETKQQVLNFWTRQIRLRWAQLFRFVGNSALSAAMCWMLLYLLIAPQAIDLAEKRFQYEMRYCRNPKAHLREIRDAQADVTSSEHEMKIIREQVLFELSGEDMREVDFEDSPL